MKKFKGEEAVANEKIVSKTVGGYNVHFTHKTWKKLQ